MQHYLTGHVPSAREGAHLLLSEDRKQLSSAGKALLVFVSAFIMLLPTFVVLALIALVKPEGEISRDSNPYFWIIAAIALAVSAVSGIGWFIAQGRKLTRSLYLGVFERIDETNPQMVEGFRVRMVRNGAIPASPANVDANDIPEDAA